eukprot:614865-Rhodomonas_salina.4
MCVTWRGRFAHHDGHDVDPCEKVCEPANGNGVENEGENVGGICLCCAHESQTVSTRDEKWRGQLGGLGREAVEVGATRGKHSRHRGSAPD